METQPFSEARRELAGFTSAAEKKALLWLAARMPSWVNSDHLTALGLLAMLLAGAAYALSRRQPLCLHLVNLCLVLNWFGDSLDGTLARYRQKQRPRYGFYVDHLVDAFGALLLLAGLALSGYMSERVAVALLIVYYLLNINIFLATYTIGTFKISYGLFGGTELRIMLAIANLAVLYRPRLFLAGRSVLLFDLIGGGAAAAIAFILLKSTIWCTRTLYERERV